MSSKVYPCIPHSIGLILVVSFPQGVLPEGAEEACSGLLCIHTVL